MAKRYTPPPTGDLPAKAARMLEHVYQSARERGYSEERAARQAWCTVDRHYYRDRASGRWRKRERPLADTLRGAGRCAAPSQRRRR